MWETWVQSLGWQDPLEKGKATHSSVWPGEFPGLYSPQGREESDMTDFHFYLSLTTFNLGTTQSQVLFFEFYKGQNQGSVKVT